HELVVVPKEAPNDDHARLIAWSKADGERVERDEIICELEFSKAVFELPAPRAGWLFHLHVPGDDVPVGSPVAAIADRPERPTLPAAPVAYGAIKVSAKAKELIELHGLDIEIFRGIDIVKERHVQDHLASRAPAPDESKADGELVALSPIRRRAAATLAESKSTIPHSY